MARTGRPRKTPQDEGQRVNLALPPKLHTLAKIVAAAKGVTLAEYFEEAVEHAINKRGDPLDRLRRDDS